ncbi:MAG: aldo/keto reductase [Rikenellaceae bacterium]|jgi:diketogulonate reductase-like aldo/keto reductase|nr:aldo/keto reductase [Rikenellaceae bacterium]
MIPSITLSNGYRIPKMGFGTFRMAPEDTVAAVKCAIEAGWRHIDTAAVYGNEKEVGGAVRESGFPRKQIFVTSKLWNADRGYDSALRAFDLTLERMGFDYLDLYLIHWPASPFFHDDWKKQNADSWKALERLYKEGRIKAIGLSNFMPRHINELLKTAEIKPMVNQIEFHPGWMQKECTDFCKEQGIVLEAWAPLIKGEILSDSVISNIASAHGCTEAQVVLSWVLACGLIPLCKSVTPSRIAENLKATEIKLTPEEVSAISSMADCGGRCYNPDCCDF